MRKHSPGSWSACHNGECKCKQIWAENHPVAVVEAGEWGDEYPEIKLEGNPGHMGCRAIPYMEKIVYGEIPEEMARANALVLAAAPDLLDACDAALQWFRDHAAAFVEGHDVVMKLVEAIDLVDQGRPQQDPEDVLNLSRIAAKWVKDHGR